jgi:hypothetical protein
MIPYIMTYTSDAAAWLNVRCHKFFFACAHSYHIGIACKVYFYGIVVD